MLKTLKWIYDLGYKHAETRYYNALKEELRTRVAREAEWQLQGENELTEQSKEYRRRHQEMTTAIDNLINDVFHPVEYIEQPIKVDRFKP